MNIDFSHRELVWDPTPEDRTGIKRWDAFCYIVKTPTETYFLKEYSYSPVLIARYHELQNSLAKHIDNMLLVSSHGARIRCLLLPDLSTSQVESTRSDTLCAVRLPYIEGVWLSSSEAQELTDMIRASTPFLKIQRIQGINCRKQPDGTIFITDIAWDIPTFLLDNPSGDMDLDELVAFTQAKWSQIIYHVYPQSRD